ncbi:Dbl homology domain-containing protein [Piromyces finnis]|uniref:Dbl homology domain-containing protein n=1 Tax=Piromyces finnis TaxID=1754191 RepID=A0A1Y1UZZ8_9FUNG|nr:Dbl homology domain-containing protein [Piromyces finnis]|eukprot:ORX44374.1 Dbl homology domain-containing protein [Piromyces finnis]
MGVKFAEPTAIQYAKALYDFNAGKKVELSLKKSDVVKIFHLDGEWCYGELNGVKGFFPHNFVKNIDEEEYNKLIKNSINNEGSMLINNISDDINEKKTKDNEDSRNNEEDENNEKDKDNKNNEKDENSEKDEDDRLKELEKQIRNSTLRKGVSNRTSTDGKRSWYNAYQGSIRYVSKNESILAMKENGPNAEKNNISMRNSSEKLSNHDMVKSKSGSSLLGNNVKSNQKVDFGFINGPAKLKMKWIDFIGGKEVADEMGLSKKDIKRQEVIYEMIDTERDYVNDLSIIIELYIKPMRNNNILSKKDLGTLFSNIEQLYGVNQELLSLFEERQKQNKCVEEIGDIWLMMNEYLKMYMLYCGNYAYAITKLEDLKSSKSISKFLNNQFHKKESRSLKLESFLIKPVQRICKYPLLLRELIKFTDESCKDYKNLINAYSKLETVVTVVNGASKEAEAAHYLIAFQSRFNPKISIVSPSRRLKYKCEVSVYMKKLSSPTQSLSSILSSGHSHNFEKKKRLLFIFDDLIIIAKSLSQGTDKLTKGKLKLIQKSEYSNLEVKSFKNSEENNLINAIEITFSNPDILTIIFCEDDEAKSEILSHLTDCIREYQSINKNESGPNIVKRLPSEKVYSMISNKSQDLIEEEEENNITSTTSEEKETNKVEINSKEEEERIIIIPENKSDEYKNGEVNFII